jgi:osmotically-inducible protein OsmY
MIGVKGVYNAACLASDERDINTILRDNVLSVKAQSALLTADGSADVQVRAYNGELFAVGVVATQADRDRAILAMQSVKGTGAIKGYIRLRDPDAPINREADDSLASSARMALGRYILHKNSDISIQAVDGRLCLMGVVGTHAEALDVIQYVETVTGKPALSLLAIRDEYATGHFQTNQLYLLKPGDDAPLFLAQDKDPQPLPNTPIRLAQNTPANAATYRAPVTLPPTANKAREHGQRKLVTLATPKDALRALAWDKAPQPLPSNTPVRLAQSSPTNASTYRARVALSPAANKARAHVQLKLTALAKQETNPTARAELLTLASQVAQDRDLSITDRLSVAADSVTQHQAKAKIQALLALY